MGEARFVGDKRVDVELVGGGKRRISGERVFLDLGTHATVPDVPGLVAAHAAFDDFCVVHDNVNGGGRTTRDRLVPYCVYTDPELARVGCNESDARRRGIRYRLFTHPLALVLRTRTLSETRGFMKMLIAADGDEILGFTAFGVKASELMAAVQTAMVGHVPYTALRRAIYAHPRAAEGLTFLLRNTPTAPAC